MKLLKPHFNLVINVSEEERANGRKRGRVNETIAHARTRTNFNLSIFHGISHAQCSYIYGWVPLQWIIVFVRFLFFAFPDWGGAFTHCMLFMLSLSFFFGCGNCDLTKNQKYNTTILHHHPHHMSCVVRIQYIIIIEFI